MNVTRPRALWHYLKLVFLSASAVLLPVAVSAEPATAKQKPKSSSNGKAQASATSKRPEPQDESKANKSLDMSVLSPLGEQLAKLGIYSGFYEFNENVEDKVVGVKKQNEVSFANRAYIQSEYHVNPDLKRENGFVGLWASVPLRSPGPENQTVNANRDQTANQRKAASGNFFGHLNRAGSETKSPSSPATGSSQTRSRSRR
jgi:hypothetical protein